MEHITINVYYDCVNTNISVNKKKIIYNCKKLPNKGERSALAAIYQYLKTD